MMQETQPLVHIGYVKTGSTWLQKYITNNSELRLREILKRSFITNNLIKPYPLYYDDSEISFIVKEQLSFCEQNNFIPVITHERLSGNPISGGYDAKILADRLKKLIPNAKILIVIREQLSFLVSCYNEYINGGGACSFKHFLFPPDGAKLPLFDFRFIEFHYLINYYTTLFSANNILVLPFELFVVEPELFVNEIISFVGSESMTLVPQNRVRLSKKALTIKIERYLNLFFFRDNSNPSAPFQLKITKKLIKAIDLVIPKIVSSLFEIDTKYYLKDSIILRIKESNQKTSMYTKFSLRNFGYLL